MTRSPSPTTTSSRTAPASRTTPAARDVLLIPGVELTLSGKHVVVINPPFAQNPGLTSLDELPAVRNETSLVIAPHPYYPGLKCLWSKLAEHIEPVRRRRVLVFLQPPDQPEQTGRRRRQSLGKAARRVIGLPQHLAGRVHLFARRCGKRHPFDHRRRQGGKGRSGDHSPVPAADVPDRGQFRPGRPVGHPPEDIRSGDRPSLGLSPFL